MHDAPAVTYPVGRTPAFGALLAAVWLGGAGAWLVWWQLSAWPLDWRAALGASTVLLSGGLALRGWRSVAQGELDWNGNEWVARLARSPAVLGDVGVHLDLQSWLLLRTRFQPAGTARWIWAGRSAAPNHWNDLRRALFSTRPAPQVASPASAP